MRSASRAKGAGLGAACACHQASSAHASTATAQPISRGRRRCSAALRSTDLCRRLLSASLVRSWTKRGMAQLLALLQRTNSRGARRGARYGNIGMVPYQGIPCGSRKNVRDRKIVQGYTFLTQPLRLLDGVGFFFGRCFGIRVLSCDLLCSPHRACKRLVAASGSLLEAAAHRAPRSALRSALALSTPALHETR